MKPTLATYGAYSGAFWDTHGAGPNPRVTDSFTVSNGDLLVCVAVGEDEPSTTFGALPTNTGTAFTWTERQRNTTSSKTSGAIWTAPATTGQSMTVSVATTGGSSPETKCWGVAVFVFNGTDGLGNSTSALAGASAPDITLVTLQDNSAIVMVGADWGAADGASRAYRTADASTFTEKKYARDAGGSFYAGYLGVYEDAGAAGSKHIGLTTPSQNWKYSAIEIKGTAAAPQAPDTFVTVQIRAA